MSAKLVKTEAVTAHIADAGKWWRDTDLSSLVIDGYPVDAQLTEAATSFALTRSLAAGTGVELEIYDPNRIVLRDVLPVEEEAEVEFNGQTFAIDQVRKTGRTVTLALHSEVAAWLKRYRKFRQVRRDTHTRAEFIYSMLREVREGTIPFYCPDLHEHQAIEKAKKKTTTTTVGKRGLSKSDHVHVKDRHRDATPDQLRALNTALNEATRLKATYRQKVALVACAIQESDATNMSGGDRDSVGLLQQRSSTGWAGNLHKVETQVYNFLRRTPAGIDPFPTVERKYPNKSVGWQVDQVQRSYTFGTGGQGKDHGQWVDAAKKIVTAYGGSSAAPTKKADGRYQFSRGEPSRPETSWAAAYRLAEEVNWRFFEDVGLALYLNDDDLLAASPAIEVSEDMPGVSIDFDYDYGKKAATANVITVGYALPVMPGLAVRLSDCGKGDGIYIVERMSRSDGSVEETIELTRTMTPRKEPAGESTTKTGKGGAKEKKSTGWVTPLAKMPSASGKFGEQRPGHLHGGIDYPCSTGTSVRSVADGTVTHAGSEGGYGNSVVVKHAGGYSTRYAHLSSFKVRNGQKVHAGDTIAKSGNTGNSSGPHLHFELMSGSHRVCPAKKVPGIPKGLCVRESI